MVPGALGGAHWEGFGLVLGQSRGYGWSHHHYSSFVLFIKEQASRIVVVCQRFNAVTWGCFHYLRTPTEDSVRVLDDDFAFCLSHVRDSIRVDRHLGGDFGDLGCLGRKHGLSALRHSFGTGSSLQGAAETGDEAVLNDFAFRLRLVRDARRASPMRGTDFGPFFKVPRSG